MKCIGFILTVMQACMLYVVHGNLCKNPSTADLSNRLNMGVGPKEGINAGNYSKFAGVHSFLECVKVCCKDESCNAVFYDENNCLTIQCASDESCAPGASSKKFATATLINLRTVAETAVIDSMKEENAAESPHIVKCEFGLSECPSDEECSVSAANARVKSGVCQCKEGFSRESGNCLPDSNSTQALDQHSTTLSAVTTTKSTTLSASAANASTTAASTAASTTPAVTTAAKVIKLTVSAGDNRVLQYPDTSVKLTAYAVPDPAKGEEYTYHWMWLQKPSGEEVGQTDGINEQELQLSKLVVGFYSLSVEVKGTNKFGTGSVNITVKPAPRVNKRPIAVIRPSVLTMKEDTAGILDGADSVDDVQVTSYLWEIVSGPITEQLENTDSSMLRLKDMTPGNYTVRLTVTDDEEETNSTLATVIVEQAIDYPPKANAGDDVIVLLPHSTVSLYGNMSSDDKGIVSYQWNAKAGDVSADTDGVDKPVLNLSHLKEGVYTYELEVTDTKGQKSTDEVHIYVKSSANKAPVAAVEFNSTTVEPGTAVVLDGSLSTDDQLITKYEWSQISGPSQAKMDNTDRAKASVDSLMKGEYVFQLTVSDSEDLHNSTSVTVHVRSRIDQKPVAIAGEDKTVVLPVDIVRIDGSKSKTSGSKLSYSWVRSEESPGAGRVLNGSDSQAALLLTDLVSGTYTFTLTVKDEEEEEASDSVTITVQPDPQKDNLVELSLDTSIETFKEKHKRNLAVELSLMLSSDAYMSDPTVNIYGIYPGYHSGKLVVVFLVQDAQSAHVSTIRNGTEVKSLLQKKLINNNELFGYKVSQVDTVVCQNECSGHGYCDQFSKQCICEPFWMPNYVVAKWKGESNCAWSILYVVLTVVASVFAVIILIWSCVCCTRRCKNTRGRRKHTYKLLHDIEEMENEEKLAKKKRSNITAGSGSIFLSETDLSSEEDTLFMNGGDNRNFNRPHDNLVKANNLKNKLRS